MARGSGEGVTGEGRRAAGRRLGRCPGWEERSWGKEEV